MERPLFFVMDEKKLIAIGKILGPFGIDGRVKVRSYSEIPGRFQGLKEVFLQLKTGLRGFLIEKVEETERGPIVLFKNIYSRKDAESLTGAEVLVDYDMRVEPPEGMYFIHDLIGVRVEDENGNFLGNVFDVLTGAANDVLEIRTKDGKELLVPVVDEFVKVMDLDKGIIVVRLIEGMEPE